MLQANINLNLAVMHSSTTSDLRTGTGATACSSNSVATARHNVVPQLVATALPWGDEAVLSMAQAGQWEVCLMADVVYDPAGYRPLVATLSALFTGGGEEERGERASYVGLQEAFMMYRPRHPDAAEFFRLLEEAGLAKETLPVSRVDDSQCHDVSLFRFFKARRTT